MQCLKCGRDTEQNGVFCEACLATMEQYPVRQGTYIQLPKRDEKKLVPKKRPPAPEEVIARQRNTIRKLRRTVAILVLLILAAAAVLVWKADLEKIDLNVGKNYSYQPTKQTE